MTYTYDRYNRAYASDFVRERTRRERIARIDTLSTLLDTAWVLPGTLTDIRRRHAMEWSGWDR